MTTLAETYIAYWTISLLITVSVGRTLHWHGRPFLIDVFGGNERTADAVNQLLIVGFYLTNAAFVTLTVRSGIAVNTLQSALELLSSKLGIVLFTLGVMHFGNLVVLAAVRRWTRTRTNRQDHAALRSAGSARRG